MVVPSNEPFLPFNADEESREAFLLGDCAFLAQTLNKNFGYELVVVCENDNTIPHHERGWQHFAVRNNAGLIIDIAGVWEEENFLAYWEQEYEILEWRVLGITPELFSAYQEFPRSFPEVDVTEAAKFVAKKLEEFAEILV